MAVVIASSLRKEHSGDVLYDGVSFKVERKDRLALAGPNGAGKTTLLRQLAGLVSIDGGELALQRGTRIALHDQRPPAHSPRPLREYVLSGTADLAAVEDELRTLEAAMVAGDHQPSTMRRYSEAQARLEHAGGYDWRDRAAAVVRGLGFTDADLDRPLSTFSGGELTRASLARVLASQPDLLLLDEPTNHLDLEARNWLEEYLHAYPFAVILVSHDRFFLDAVVTRIADLTLRTLTDYVGNYSDYIVQHEERMAALRKAKHEQDEEVARVKMFIDRFRYQATKASQVQSRIKMLEKVVPIEVPPERKKIHFNFPSCGKSGRAVIELKNVRKTYGDLVIFDKLNLHIERGDRIALVGPNGVGKSTLMRMLSGEETPDAGERVDGHHLVMQYFAQDEATRMDPAPTVYETLSSGSPLQMVPMIRNILGGFLFSGDDVYKHVRVLSGGERTRLAVARMLLRPSNTLLLDEPTNHLDLDSKEVLLDALVDYGGTLIFVSHDRYFVERLATKIIEVGNGTALVYPRT